MRCSDRSAWRCRYHGEISLTWNHLILHTIDPKPLILVGEGWHRTMETFFTSLNEYVSIKSREYVSFAPNPETAIDILRMYAII